MNWRDIAQWQIHHEGSAFIVKVNPTVEDTSPELVVRDGNLRLDRHKTSSGREVGYVLQYKAPPSNPSLPRVVVAKSCAYLLYRPEDYRAKTRGSIFVVHKDINVRLLKYKVGRYVDFMFVMRATSMEE
jgi:hypothetical protein